MELSGQDVKELFKTLGSIETKQESICAAVGQVQKRLADLPCESRGMELGKRVTWKQLLTILGMGCAIFFGALGLHYDLTTSHAEDRIIHVQHKGKK